MTPARRFAWSALLLGSAVLAGAVVAGSVPRYAGARVPRARDLPWPSTVRARATPPFALLYVQSACTHCSRAAVLFDSLTHLRGIAAVIATNDPLPAAERYRAKLGLQTRLAIDSGGVLIRALATQSVPTLVLFHADGSRQLVVGFTGDRRYRAILESFDR
jgi:hypothetical protein